MAAGSALKKINARAKQICNSTGCAYRAAQKKAGAEYRAGHLGRVVTMHKKKRKTKRRKVGRSTGVLYRSSGKNNAARAAIISGRPYNGMIGSGGHSSDDGSFNDHYSSIGSPVGMGSVKKALSHAKKILEHNIGKLETKKFVAKKKAAKRKISKRIAEMKSKFRKIC